MKKINVKALAVIAAFTMLGFVSGVIGELWLNSFLLPEQYVSFKNYSDLAKRIDDLVAARNSKNESKDQRDVLVEEAVNQAQSSTVRIYKTKKFSEVGSSLLPADFLTMGTVITTDGWILSADKNLIERGRYLVVTYDNKVFETTEVNLAYPGAAFLKINALNLSVVQFSSRQDLTNGQSVILFSGNKGTTLSTIQNTNYSKLDDAVDFVHSSESFYKYILLEKSLGKEFLGSPIITLTGRMVGILGETNGLVVPTDYLAKTMRNIQTVGKEARPFLGIKYWDLSELANPLINETRGAIVLKDKNQAFLANSPAANVLEAGDVILKVEGEEINANRNLSEVLASYKTNDVLKFVIKRGDGEKTVEIKLN